MTKNKLTQPCQEIFDEFEKSGKDFDCYLGDIIQGKESASLLDMVYFAQVFSNKEYRGALASSTAFKHNLNRMKTLSNVDGLFYDKFTSYVLIDKTQGLGDLRETYTNTEYNPFFAHSISTDFSKINEALNGIVANTKVQNTRKFAIRKDRALKLLERNEKNSVCELVDKIYQIAYAKAENNYKSNLEKVTAAIFATLITTRALDLRTKELPDCESRLNEALKLNFINHLNGCYDDNKTFSISKIVKDGARVGMGLIDELGLGKDDVKDKCQRLGTPLKHEPNSLFEALFGGKVFQKSLVVIEDVNEASKFDAATNEDVNKTEIDLSERVKEVLVTPPPAPGIYLTDGTRTEVVKPTQEVAEKSQIAKSGETIAKVGEKVVDQNAVVGNPGDVAHKMGNAVNHSTLKNNLLNIIKDRLIKEAAIFENLAEKQKDFDAATKSNFFIGASYGIKGHAAEKNRTPAYYEGHKKGQYMRRGLVQEIDKLYSPDKKTLLVVVNATGRQVTSNLGDLVVKAFGFETFAEFVDNVVSSLSTAFEKFKKNTANTSNQQTP